MPAISLDDPHFANVVDELAKELESQGTIDWAKYEARWPQYINELKNFTPTLEAMLALGPLSKETLSRQTLSKEAVPPSDDESPQILGTLGDFRLLREVGRGGMGIVYEAEQISLGRRVALKIMPFAAMIDPRQLQRFKNEARTAATLAHPNIVSVYSVGCERGLHYFAMQYIEGRSLAEVIAGLKEVEGQRTPSHSAGAAAPGSSTVSLAALGTDGGSSQLRYHRIAKLGIAAARALDYAHQCGVVHRDVKPSNLLLDKESKLWVADFGLATTAQEANLTITGDVMGTLRYMSPEQIRGERAVVDHRTDIYSLGVTLYELLALLPAFRAAKRHELLSDVVQTEPARLRKIRPGLPPDLETIVLTAIHKDPSARYQTAEALALDLERFLEHRPIKARPTRPWEAALKWAHRRPAWAALMAVCIFACAVVIGLQTWHGMTLRAALKRTEELRQESLARGVELRTNAYAEELETAAKKIGDFDFTGARELLVRSGHSDFSSVRGPEWEYLARLAEEPTPLWKRSLHDSAALTVAIAPSGNLAASGDAKGWIWVWNPQDGSIAHHLAAHEGECRALIFSPDSSRLYSAGQDRKIHTWDTHSWECTHTCDEAHNHTIFGLALNQDGSLLLSAARDDGGIKLWNTSDMSTTLAIDCEGTYDVAFSPDEKLILSVHTKRTLCRWSAADGRLVERHDFKSDSSFQALAVAKEIPAVFAAGYGSSVSRVHPATGNPGLALVAPSQVYALAWSSQHRSLLLAGGEGFVARWRFDEADQNDIHTGWRKCHAENIAGIAWLPGSSQFVTACRDGSVALWDMAAIPLDQSRVLVTGKGPLIEFTGLAISADGRYVATKGTDSPVQVTEVKTGRTRAVLQGDSPEAHLHFAARDRLLVGSVPGALGLWDAETGRLMERISFPEQTVANVTVSPNGETAAVTLPADNKGSIAFVNLSQRKLLEPTIACTHRPKATRYSADGKRLLILHDDPHGPELVDLTSKEPRRQMLSGISSAYVGLSPDGHLLASIVQPEVHLYDLADKGLRRSRQLAIKAGGVFDFDWSPDGRLLAVARATDQLELWHMPTKRLCMAIPAGPFDLASQRAHDVRYSQAGQCLVIGLHARDERGNTLVQVVPLGDKVAAELQP